MGKLLKKQYSFTENPDDLQRQYIDARTVFMEWEAVRKAAAEVRGTMFWRYQGKSEYLIRQSPNNSQRSIGPRSTDTETIFQKFMDRKSAAEARLSSLDQELTRQQRMNRALFVGHAPNILIDILDKLYKSGISEHFLVVGTHALYAYEAAAGVRFKDATLATRDVDLLWDTRKRVSFITAMENLGSSLFQLLKKVDPSFRLRDDQLYTAINEKGFEVDILRRPAGNDDPHPLQTTDDDEEFWAVQASTAGILISAPRFTSIVVASSGKMARINTVSPLTFVKCKRLVAVQPDRDPLKRQKDLSQADLVEDLAKEYFPQITA